MVLPKHHGGAAIYDWTPGKRIMGLLVEVLIERCCWIRITWLFLILWIVGGGKELGSTHTQTFFATDWQKKNKRRCKALLVSLHR